MKRAVGCLGPAKAAGAAASLAEPSVPRTVHQGVLTPRQGERTEVGARSREAEPAAARRRGAGE